MTAKELWKLFTLLRRPIPWDPVPRWLRLTPEQMKRFEQIQFEYAAKQAELENEKLAALEKLARI